MTDEEAQAIADKLASALAEHFDNVRIFVQWPTPNDEQRSKTYNTGRGNWWAQYGQIKEWIVMEEHRARIEAEKPDD